MRRSLSPETALQQIFDDLTDTHESLAEGMERFDRLIEELRYLLETGNEMSNSDEPEDEPWNSPTEPIRTESLLSSRSTGQEDF